MPASRGAPCANRQTAHAPLHQPLVLEPVSTPCSLAQPATASPVGRDGTLPVPEGPLAPSHTEDDGLLEPVGALHPPACGGRGRNGGFPHPKVGRFPIARRVHPCHNGRERHRSYFLSRLANAASSAPADAPSLSTNVERGGGCVGGRGATAHRDPHRSRHHPTAMRHILSHGHVSCCDLAARHCGMLPRSAHAATDFVLFWDHFVTFVTATWLSRPSLPDFVPFCYCSVTLLLLFSKLRQPGAGICPMA
jgi:hypothetical protein